MDFGKVARGLVMLALLLPLVWWVSGCAPIMAQARVGREVEAAQVRAQVAADVLLLSREGCTKAALQAAIEEQGIARDEAKRRSGAAWLLGAWLCPRAAAEKIAPVPAPCCPPDVPNCLLYCPPTPTHDAATGMPFWTPEPSDVPRKE